MILCCFKEPKEINLSSSNNNSSQHVVTCIYKTQLCNSRTYHLTLTWSKTISSHSLTIHAPYIFSNSITILLNPLSTSISLRNKLHGSKSIFNRHYAHKIKLHWNFAKAKFTQNSVEPHSCFYFAISYNGIIQFLMGDIQPNLKWNNHEKSSNSVQLSKREHVFGSTRQVSRVILMGSKHEIEIECKEGVLDVKVDGEMKLVVKRMAWEVRGYEKIVLIEGIQVEFYWDVLLSWSQNNNSSSIGQSVFVFQVGEIKGPVWPEMVGVQKRLLRKSVSDSDTDSTLLLQWAEENSSANGFSLLPYAWTLY